MKPKLRYWRDHSNRKAQELGNSFKTHDWHSERLVTFTQDYMFELLGARRPLKILDVGCGNGLFLSPMTRDHVVFGVDVATGMLGISKTNGNRPVNALAEALPFAAGTFDAVFCIEMLQCVDNGGVLVQEMVRVLKPGGLLGLHTLNRSSVMHRLYSLIDTEKDLRRYEIRELLGYADLPDTTLEKVIFNYYPAPLKTTSRIPSRLARLAASSFAVIARKG